MISIPFNKETFAAEMKPLISGNNLTLEYDNIESSMAKVVIDLGDLLGPIVDKLTEYFFTAAPSSVQATAINYMQRALLHFAMYEHTIFLITRVGNDGITVKKNDDETTVFKYQQDQLENKYIALGWFWTNRLIAFLNSNLAEFPEWENSTQKQDADSVPVNLSDFNKWVGVTVGGEYFMLNVTWIIREVWIDCVCSRIINPEKTDTIARAVCYDVMWRACERLAYACLPEGLRKDIDNEMGKNHKAEADRNIREKVSKTYKSKAETYWNALDLELKNKDIENQKADINTSPIIGKTDISANDPFYFV